MRSTTRRLSYMCDNLILLEIDRGKQPGRRISAYQTRGSTHDDRAHLMPISAAGVQVD